MPDMFGEPLGGNNAQYENEASFKLRLYNILSREPYRHNLFAHDRLDGSVRQFNISGSRGYVDLYMLTNPRWQWHDLFKAIGIEVKLGRDMGWLVDAIYQVKGYWDERRKATYKRNGRPLPAPDLFLLCTNTSFHEGELYHWHAGTDFSTGGRFRNADERLGGWKAITDFCDRILMKEGAAILRQGFFYSNLWHGHAKGPIRRFELYQ